jgi:hypothetical protein
MAKSSKKMPTSTSAGNATLEKFWNTGAGNTPFFQPGQVIPKRDTSTAKLPGVGEKVKGAETGMGSKGGKYGATTYAPTKDNKGMGGKKGKK